MIGSIPSPPSSGFHLGSLEVHVYGLMYVLGLAAAVLITVRRWEAKGGSRDLVYDVAKWGFPAGLVGGRLYFDLTSSGEVPPHWWGPFAVWDGGMGIWGGIALGTIVGLWRLRRAGAPVGAFMDAAAPALLVGQAIGRIGNYFNQELFGGPTSLPWAVQISPAHRPAGYANYATFHPTFLYELIWNLALAAFLVWLGRNRRIRPPGLFALYVAGYSGFRIFEDSLRVDPAHHILGLRLNFYVATLLCLGGLIWFTRIQGWRPSRRLRRGATFVLVGGAVLMSGCGEARHPGADSARMPHPTHFQSSPVSSASEPVGLQTITSRLPSDSSTVKPADLAIAAAPSGSAGGFLASSNTRATSPRTAFAMWDTGLRSPFLSVKARTASNVAFFGFQAAV